MQPTPAMAIREFQDQNGKRWRAWETIPVTTAGLEADYCQGWLTFDDGTERRRLSPVPPNWEALPPERLTLLLRVAHVARQRDVGMAPLDQDSFVVERRESERRHINRRACDREELATEQDRALASVGS